MRCDKLVVPKKLRALARAGPSYATASNALPLVVTAVAAAPVTQRAVMSTTMLGARPLISNPAANTTRPQAKTFLLPMRSAKLPVSPMKLAKVNRKPLTTHDVAFAPACRSWLMLASDTPAPDAVMGIISMDRHSTTAGVALAARGGDGRRYRGRCGVACSHAGASRKAKTAAANS